MSGSDNMPDDPFGSAQAEGGAQAPSVCRAREDLQGDRGGARPRRPEENAEYHAAKEKQSHIEGRILDLNDWIARAEVIDPSKLGGDKVVFGATVDLVDVESDKPVSYRIVGELEADIKKRWLAVTSPVARALIGKKVGDVATVQSPGGVRELEVREIRFEDPEDAPAA